MLPGNAAIATLTDTFLLQLIISFQSCVPGDVLERAGLDRWNSVAVKAVKWGDLALLQRVHRCHLELPEVRYLCFRDVWITALRSSVMPILEWLRDNYPMDTTTDSKRRKVVRSALASGSVAVIEFLLSMEPSICASLREDDLTLLMEGDGTELLTWLCAREKTLPVSEMVLKFPATRGHFDAVRLLLAYCDENEIRINLGTLLVAAASGGALDLVRYLHENPATVATTDAMDRAAQNGHMDVLRFLHENRTEGCTRKAMELAAGNGHLDAVRFVHEHYPQCDSPYAMSRAARSHCNLPVVQYLHEQGIHSNYEGAIRVACSYSDTVAKDIVQVCPSTVSEASNLEAACLGRDKIVQMFHETYHDHSCSPKIVAEAARHDCVRVVQYLVKNCSAVDGSALLAAASGGHLELVKLLATTVRSGCLVMAIHLTPVYVVQAFCVAMLDPDVIANFSEHEDCSSQPERTCGRQFPPVAESMIE